VTLHQEISDGLPVARFRAFNHFNYEHFLLSDQKEYLRAFLRGDPFPPFEAELQITSKCNLHCRWCIGKQMAVHSGMTLPVSRIDESNIGKIVDHLCAFRTGNLRISLVKISGLAGDPLAPESKATSTKAIELFAQAGVKVGLFTNAASAFDRRTEDLLQSLYYLNISLDAGPRTYARLKETRLGGDTFFQVLKNIERTAGRKRQQSSFLNDVSAGYVVVPENLCDILEATRLVKESGADGIRFKLEFTNLLTSPSGGFVREAGAMIEQAHERYATKGFFVHMTNSPRAPRGTWKPGGDCYARLFHITVGPDGNVYPCDHFSLVGAPSPGNLLDQPLDAFWPPLPRSQQPLKVNCRSFVCPPFAEAINCTISRLNRLGEQYGYQDVIEALDVVAVRPKD
jgi:MoaA/NifB/PqqE/SkfB family radical SAM enzyme